MSDEAPRKLSKNYCKDALEEFIDANTPEEKDYAGKFLYKRLISLAEIDYRKCKATNGEKGGKIAKEIYVELVDRMFGKVAKTMEISGLDGDPISTMNEVKVLFVNKAENS